MKRKITQLTAALALLVALAIPLGMWGQTREAVTLQYTGNSTFIWEENTNYADQLNLSESDWSVTGQKNDASNMTACNKDGSIRLYPKSGNGSSITVSSSNGATISSISFVMQLNEPTVKVNGNTIEPVEGVYTINSTSFMVINGIDATSGNQVQIKSISINYEGGTPTPTTYTVTYDCNGASSGCPENVTGIEPGTDITLADAPTKTNYDFVGWSDGANIYEAGEDYTVNGNVTFTAQWTAQAGGNSQTLTFDLTSNPGDWPTTNSNTLTEYTYTLNGVDYTFALKNVKCNSGYLMIYYVGAVGLPAIEGYKLTTVVAHNSNGCSTTTQVGISSSASQASYIAGGAAQTWSSTGSTYTYNLTSTEENTMYYLYVTNKNAQLFSLDLTYEAVAAAAVATPTFSPASGTEFGNEGIDVTITCATENSTIYYTLDGSTPDNQSTLYSGVIHLTETKTVNAIAYVGTDASNVATATYTYVDPNAPGTVNNPYTVAQARAAIDANTGITDVYATGIVSAIPTAWSTQYNNITFNFVDNEGDTDFLQAYRCVSGTGVDASTVAVGDVVVVFGTLKKHTDGTYEFGSGCQLVSLTHPVITTPTVTVTPNTINAPAEGADGTLVLTYENITDFIAFDYSFCDAEGGDLQEDPDWIYAEINEEGDSYSLDYLIDANDGAARTAYIKVYTFDDELEEVYAIVTVNQAEYVAPTYATLPFEFDGGKGAIESTNGLYQEGLGSDYNNSPKLKFDGAGDYVLLQFEERPGTLTFDIKGNGSGSDPWAGVFKVMVSTNGVNFVDKVVYETGGLTSEKATMTIDDLAADVRYIKWVYVTKTLGNVALGNINLAAYQAPVASITVTPDEVNVDAEEHDGTLALTYENLEIESFDDFDIQYYDAQGEETTEPDWIEVTTAEDGDNLLVSYYMIENDGDARTAYFKVYAMDAETNLVYSNLVTVTQAAPVAPAYYVCSENGVAGEPVEVTTPGTTVTLAPGQDLNSDFTFAGWTDDEDNVDQLITEFTPEAGTSYAFFAVYAHTTGAPTSKEGEGSYVKVTNTADITDGNYLIVYEGGAVAFDGSLETLDVADNTISIFDNYDAENNVIASNNAMDAAIFTITSKEGGYSVKSASGLYIGATAYENSLKTNEEDIYTNIISIDGGNLVMQVAVNTTQAVTMKYNSASNQNRFRYYKSGQEAIQLYKYVAGSTPTPALTTAYYTRVFIDETVEEDIEIVGPSIVPSGEILDMGSYNLENNLGYSKLIIEDGGQLKIANTVNGTIQKNVAGYGNSTNGNYVLLATPASMDACNNTGMWPTTGNDHQAIQANIDFYSFDQSAELEWQNFKYGYSYFAGPYLMARGQGYLYANPNDVTLTLQTRGYSYPSGQTVIHEEYPFEPTNAAYTVPTNELGYTETADWAGWNLVGNPFTCDAYLNRTYFRMNEAGDAILEGDGAIKPCEGVFVVVTGEDKNVKFRDSQWLTSPRLSVNLNGNNKLLDRVSLHFDGSNNIKKFVLSENASKLYIQQGMTDYAVVNSANEGEMPVSFKAKNNGTYTLSVNTENVEMTYLHLIDNMTGADVDLLATPSYSFEAKTTDYASRFRLVFSANSSLNENGNETFAFFNGSEWVISNMGEATLQVVDVMGRVLSTETVNGNATMNLNQTPGVYMLRLVNGENVRVQKVVVR